MDFFEAQELARKRTGRLVALFILAVIGTVAAGYGSAVLIKFALAAKGWYEPIDYNLAASYWDPQLLLGVALATCSVVGLASAGKWFSFRSGGAAVAEMLGGRRVSPETKDLKERQLLNVVEEMAIASGVPCPATFILADESTINAFAAGLNTHDAVVAVTHGTLQTLNRDELQGVVAHEFSHILNGDMRLNLKLTCIVFGILAIGLIGQAILRPLFYARVSTGGSRGGGRKGGGGIILIWIGTGLAALIIGYVGYFFGRLIQAAVSRQREFLADASAVQFTRNPLGITGALKKIGGQHQSPTLASPKAAQINHCFFSQNFRARFGGGMATHPPLAERIKAIDPAFDGKFVSPRAPTPTPPSPRPRAPASTPAGLPPILPSTQIPVDPLVLLGSVGLLSEAGVDEAKHILTQLPPELRDAARDPFTARAVVFAMLLDSADATRTQQLSLLESRDAEVADGFAKPINNLPVNARLPLVQLAFPALRELSNEQHLVFLENIKKLTHADSVVTPFEFALRRLVTHGLAGARAPHHSGHAIYSFGALNREITIVLSTLAHAGAIRSSDAAQAFAQGADQRPVLKMLQLLPEDTIDLDELDTALDRLANAALPIKQRLIAAACAVIAADGTAHIQEIELLRAICAALDCPMPPVSAPGG